MRHHLLASYAAIQLPARKGKPRAGARQGFKSKQGQQPGTADIPWIGNDERTVTCMKLLEYAGFFGLGLHSVPPLEIHWRKIFHDFSYGKILSVTNLCQ
jgi:hypothetical protein